MYKLWIFFSLFYMLKSDDSIDIFKKLNEVNKQWLQITSIPEAARLLQHPPYSYHLKSDPSNYLNISELFSKDVSTVENDVNSKEIGKCSDDLLQIFFNLGSQWALQMIDSDGKLSSGLLRGGLIWPGHYSECINVYSPEDESGHGNFHGQYCVAALSMNLGKKYSNLPLTVGICIPDSCSDKNIKVALKNISHILDSKILEHFPVLKRYSSMLSLKDFSCKLKTKEFDIASILYLTIVVSFIILSVIGTATGLIDNWKSRSVTRTVIPDEEIPHNQEEISHASNRSNNPVSISSVPHGEISRNNSLEKDISYDKAFLVQNDALVLQSAKLHSKRPVYYLLKKVLLCFSIIKNGEKILNIDVVDGQLLSIHGIRFLSLTWVILGHTYITAAAIIGNRLDVLNDMDSFLFQMLLQSPLSVDSFFVLSGFLLGYLFLKEASKKNGKVNWLYFYVHRFWRLTPAYMVVVFFYLVMFKYLGSGPFWDDNHCDDSRNSWWKYLLYINNFIPIHQMCVGWSWYLANDMQFYIISPLFLYPLWRWPVAGFSILSAILIGTWTTTGILSYKYDLIPMFVGVTQTTDFANYEERMWNSFDLIYDKPYCRIAPYIIGVILGYILHQVNQRKNFLTWWQQLLGWIVAAFCSLSVVFGLYHVEMSKTTALFYNALCRSSFSIGLCWLIFVCETGHGGFLTKLLSWKLWIPLSRLTYCAYLIHPILIHGYYQAYQTALYFTELLAVTNFMGFLLMSYGLAFIFSVTFESPLMNLEKLVVKKKQK